MSKLHSEAEQMSAQVLFSILCFPQKNRLSFRAAFSSLLEATVLNLWSGEGGVIVQAYIQFHEDWTYDMVLNPTPEVTNFRDRSHLKLSIFP